MIIENKVLLDVSEEDIPENGKFIVPTGITEIAESSFEGCNSLRQVNIPNGVTKIGNYAFNYCRSLKEVTISDSITEIGNWAFGNCESLIKIQLPESITYIGGYAFVGCKSLKEIKLPNSLLEISGGAFYDCKSLKRVYMPDKIKAIDGDMFRACKSLEEIYIPENVTFINDYAFECCENLHLIQWGEKHYNVKCVDDFCMHVKNEKYLQDIKILRCSYFPNKGIVYVAEKDEYTAHGKTIREAVEDLQFKILQDQGFAVHIQRIAAQGYMDANDYRLITGACREGTSRFLKTHNLTWNDRMSVEDVLKLTEGQYGFDRFQEVANQILELT